MLLLEIEKQVRKLSKSDMARLIQDVQSWLKGSRTTGARNVPGNGRAAS